MCGVECRKVMQYHMFLIVHNQKSNVILVLEYFIYVIAMVLQFNKEFILINAGCLTITKKN